MSGALQPYPRYKESGVEWLGAVPVGWEVTCVKYLTHPGQVGIKIGPFGSAIKLEMMVDESEGFPVVGQENVINQDFGKYRRFLPFDVKAQFSAYSVLPKDALITMMGTSGRCAIVPEENPFSIIDSHLMRLRLNDLVESTFFQRVFDEAPYVKTAIQLFSKGSIMAGLNSGIVANIPIALPPLPEQQAIADYLDTATQRIDTLIAELREMIRLLKEKRQALISHCVTKGLDPAVPMKNSGVEWLGEVPEGWEVVPLKYVMEFEDSVRIPISATERADVEKVFPYYGASGIIDHVDDYLFDQPRLLVAEDGANLLSRSTPLAFIASGKYWVNNHAHILKPTGIGLRLAQAFLASVVLDPWITGAAQPKLTSEALGTIPIPVPPREEQKVIESHLDRETAKIDRLISETEDTITLMQERRAALISSVVTGKLQVPGTPQPSGSTLNSRSETLR